MNHSPDKQLAKKPTGDELKFVQEQFVTLFLKQNNRAQSAILLSCVFIFMLLLLRSHSVWPYIWMGCVVIVSLARFVFANRWIAAAGPPIKKIIGLMLVNGALLAAPVFSFRMLADIDRAFITIVLTAVATASVAATNGYKGVFLWFAVPLLVPLGLGWVLHTGSADASEWVRWGIASLTILYLIYLMKLGGDVNSVFVESCRIRFLERDANSRLSYALNEAKKANQAKSRFLAAASHDLRQPLHTIGVLLAAIGLRNLDDRSREIVNMLSTVSKSFSGQLDGLLDISKLDAGVVNPNLRTQRLDKIINAHAEHIEPLALEKGLYVRTDCTQPVFISTDIHLLQRVLSNLTANALKFTAHGGVSMTLKQINDVAILEVTDSGIGIAAEHQDLIFQEFYQVGNTERDRSVGLGLGLAIVQRICSLMHIDVQLVSSLGHGTRFTLTMPCVDDESVHTEPSPLNDLPKFQRLNALVVDDEADIRQGMRLLLDELGCSVALADGIAPAMQLAREQKFDVIISDFRLRNNETGLDAINQVCVLQPHIYPLLISGDTDPVRLAEAHASGIALLHKPVSVESLIKHLQKVG
jgi:signal transduction histidine kinase/CheY-like chemotaxis protein